MFKKVLIANRGEIAVRVIHACRELGIKALAVFSEADRLGRHVRIADEAWLLEGQPGKVYLDIEQIVATAKQAGAEAVHPGYGFLAENAQFAAACTAAGLVFIGPASDVIQKMGSKIESRRIMEKAGVPVVPGTTDPVTDVATVKELCTKYGYPVAIKASAGGGGRGLRVVHKEADVEQALAGAQREGSSYFGSGEVYLEKYLERPRHIEVQILGDTHGNVIHLFERDCSTQRRHQKLVEESPAVHLDPELRKRLLSSAVQGAKAIGYTSAGTVECLVAGGQFYFLEMNTRVQVEHPVTEYITGLDIVKEQIRIAAGEKLSLTQQEVVARGHAIECRINAEDPYKQFMPSPGVVNSYLEPSSPWVRVDSACYSGYQILPFYDSLLAKLVCWGSTRQEAIARMKLALDSFEIKGVSTTIPFHQALMNDPTFVNGEVYTSYIEGSFIKSFRKPDPPGTGSTNGDRSADGKDESVAVPEPSMPRKFEVEVNRKHFKVEVRELSSPQLAAVNGTPAARLAGAAAPARGRTARPAGTEGSGASSSSGEVKSSMHGLVKQLLVEEGQKVSMGHRLIIFEAMKMESEILSDREGTIASIKVKAGDTVEAKQLLLILS